MIAMQVLSLKITSCDLKEVNANQFKISSKKQI